MVNWSLDDGDSGAIQPARRRRKDSRSTSNQSFATTRPPSTNGRVRKIINGEVVYVRIRRVVKTQA